MTPNVPGSAMPVPAPETHLPVDAAPVLNPELAPDISVLVTEDDTPIDSIFLEKQQRLLTEPLYSSWAGPGEGQSFLALANVGLFHTYGQPPLVPDALLSLDVAVGDDLRRKENHSYFLWLMGKPPDVVIEIVSDRRGGEAGVKQRAYARMGVLFYVIFDPEDLLGGGVLRVFVLQRRRYEPLETLWFPEVGLGMTLWSGVFEGHHQTWLRWCDAKGRLIPTGAERADEERQRADEERQRADEERQRVERLVAQLRALGSEPQV
jgi:hypothetical protein